MQYYPAHGTLRSDALLQGTNQFRFDLTEEERRLCDWVAQQARTGVRQIRYQEAMAALEIREEQLTRMLRMMRERLDEIHEMVEAPIVNTWAPYFEVPVHARYIWDNYRLAEKEVRSEARVENRPFELVQS
jgi:hypothetical protein